MVVGKTFSFTHAHYSKAATVTFHQRAKTPLGYTKKNLVYFSDPIITERGRLTLCKLQFYDPNYLNKTNHIFCNKMLHQFWDTVTWYYRMCGMSRAKFWKINKEFSFSKQKSPCQRQTKKKTPPHHYLKIGWNRENLYKLRWPSVINQGLGDNHTDKYPPTILHLNWWIEIWYTLMMKIYVSKRCLIFSVSSIIMLLSVTGRSVKY